MTNKEKALAIVEKETRLNPEQKEMVIQGINSMPGIDNYDEANVIQITETLIKGALEGVDQNPENKQIIAQEPAKKSKSGKVLDQNKLVEYYQNMSEEDKKAAEQLLTKDITQEQRNENTNNSTIVKFILSNPDLKDRMKDPNQTTATFTPEDVARYSKKKDLWETYPYDSTPETLENIAKLKEALEDTTKAVDIKFPDKYGTPAGVILKLASEDKEMIVANKTLGKVILDNTNGMIIDEAHNFAIVAKVREFEDINSTVAPVKVIPTYQGLINYLDKENGKGADMIVYTKEVLNEQEAITVPLDIKIVVQAVKKEKVNDKRVVERDKNGNIKKRVFRPRATIEGKKLMLKDEFKKAGFTAGIGQAQVRKAIQPGTVEFENAKASLVAMITKVNAASAKADAGSLEQMGM